MRLVVRPAARRDGAKVTPIVSERIQAAIDALAKNPRPSGYRLLRDRSSRTWRVRVGDWRILYDIDDDAGVVTVLRILHRSKAY